MQQRSYLSASRADDTPLARLYHLYASPLLAYVRQHVPSQEDAEDIVVEVFIAALEKADPSLFTCKEQEQMAWLRRVAYHKCVDHHRRSLRRPTVSVDSVAQRLVANTNLRPDQVALRDEQNAQLAAHLSKLSEQDRLILRLRFASGLRCTEISRLLRKREGTIRVSLSRALNRLRTIYWRQPEEDKHVSG